MMMRMQCFEDGIIAGHSLQSNEKRKMKVEKGVKNILMTWNA